MTDVTHIRGTILHFLSAPDSATDDSSHQLIEDGVLTIADQKIIAVNDWSEVKNTLTSSAVVMHYPNGLIIPGFIDTHIHYPQLDMIAASEAGDLFSWLNKYTFPQERKFSDPEYATEVAEFFINECLRNGTTTCMAFGAIFPQSVAAIFAAAAKRQMRLIAGQVLQDRNLPDYLQISAEQGYVDSVALIKNWHHKPGTRLSYSICFRYPITTSTQLFETIQALKRQFPDVYVHSHISETREEVAWVKELYPVTNYLDVYDAYGLLGHKTLLAHGIYLTDAELARIAQTQTGIAFSPLANLFLGSGLFDLERVRRSGVNVGLATDVGAGTSFSMLQVFNESYKVLQLQQQNFSALAGIYYGTLGGAKALALDDKLGNFLPGKEADFIVLDLQGATPLLKRRLAAAKSFHEKLFALLMLGDDRSIIATYVAGSCVYKRKIII